MVTCGDEFFCESFGPRQCGDTIWPLKAMESLQNLNPNKDEASDAQIMFWSCTHLAVTCDPP